MQRRAMLEKMRLGLKPQLAVRTRKRADLLMNHASMPEEAVSEGECSWAFVTLERLHFLMHASYLNNDEIRIRIDG